MCQQYPLCSLPCSIFFFFCHRLLKLFTFAVTFFQLFIFSTAVAGPAAKVARTSVPGTFLPAFLRPCHLSLPLSALPLRLALLFAYYCYCWQSSFCSLNSTSSASEREQQQQQQGQLKCTFVDISVCVTACVCICVCMCVCCLSDNIHCVFAICLLVILLFCLLEPEIAQQFAVRTCLQYKRIRKGYSPWAFLLQCNWLTVAMTGLSIKTASGKRSHCCRLLIH